MPFFRALAAYSQSFIGPSARLTKRRKGGKNNKQSYDRLEPRQLLAPLINEFVAANSNGLLDDNGNATDWIELFNNGPAVNLAGYSLTDDPGDTSKYVFGNRTLAAGEYLVVFAGDDVDPTCLLYTSPSPRDRG